MDAARLLTTLLAALVLAAPAAGQILGREAALQALKDPDAAQRKRGVVGLARNGRMTDAPALVAALRDPDESVRATAEQALWIVWSRSGDAAVDKLFARGLEEMNGGRFDDGIATFSRVIELAPGFAEGWNKRATLYFLVGDYRKSLADCDEVMKRNPAHFGALAGYGQIYLRLDEPEKALEYFKRALAVNPNMGSVEAAVRLLEHSLGQGKKTI
jgi:tetratricopeptide (TPR) repeat protein